MLITFDQKEYQKLNDKWTELLKIPIRERIDNEEYQAFSKD